MVVLLNPFNTIYFRLIIELKKMKRIYMFILIAGSTLLLDSCKKNEGPGGSSSITGVVHAYVHDGAGNLLTEYDIAKEDVFIIYGNEATTFDDDTKTSYDGTFKFEYLEEGNYQLFVYSKCSTCPGNKAVLIKDVEITDKKSTVAIDTFFIEK